MKTQENMKLELKHLAPYLPYQLSTYGASDIWGIHQAGIEDVVITNGLHVQSLAFDDFTSDYSMLLRPLSDLTREIEHGGERFVPMEFFRGGHGYTDFYYSFFNRKSISIYQIEYWIIEKLLEWHFDVFGLIDSGLAIDINNLEK